MTDTIHPIQVERLALASEEANGIKAELTARVKELEKQNAQLSSYNDQPLADFSRQAGYIDRVLEQEAPQDVQMAPQSYHGERELVAKGPRVQGLHGRDISVHDYLRNR